MSFGGTLQAGNSKLFAGPLGVVKIGYKGYDLGKTSAETTLKPDQDIKDIIYQQDGTKAADRVRTGLTYVLTATFSEIKTSLLKQLVAGIDSSNTSSDSDSAVIGRSVYQSMRNNEAGVLKVAACSGDGIPSEDAEDIMYFYEAIANVNGNLVNWGADTQRNLTVEFHIFFHTFAAGESSTHRGAFGYLGNPDDEDVPAANWPDVAAPVILTASVVSATSMSIVFDKNVTEVNNLTTETHIIVSVDGVFVAPTASNITGKTLTLTFPSSTFSAGKVVLLTMSRNVVKDSNNNVNEAVGNRVVTNNLT